jgi:hypothetical protein
VNEARSNEEDEDEEEIGKRLKAHPAQYDKRFLF